MNRVPFISKIVGATSIALGLLNDYCPNFPTPKQCKGNHIWYAEHITLTCCCRALIRTRFISATDLPLLCPRKLFRYVRHPSTFLTRLRIYHVKLIVIFADLGFVSPSKEKTQVPSLLLPQFACCVHCQFYRNIQ